MKHTIVFADNVPGIRQLVKQELEADGFRVLLAEDGAEAIEVLENIAADLVVLDEHMPRCGGLQAARQIKRQYPSLPVILFTADPYYEQYQSPSVDASVIKTEDISALKATVAELLLTPKELPAFDRVASFE